MNMANERPSVEDVNDIITIAPSPTADTRSCDWSKVSLEQLCDSSVQHRADVVKGFEFFVRMMQRQAELHDHDKLSNIKGFHADFKTGFAQTGWWDTHRKINRHHLLQADGVPDDVNLVDVFDLIVDCTMAGVARIGDVYPLTISEEVLRRAFDNTCTLLRQHVSVVSEPPVTPAPAATSGVGDAEKVAREIAEDLFHMNSGEEADHLQLWQDLTQPKRYLGGWSKKAVIDRIAAALRRDVAVQGWRPIETMPFGREVLLLWLGGSPTPHYEIVMGVISPNNEWSREQYWSPCGEYRSMEKMAGWLAASARSTQRRIPMKCKHCQEKIYLAPGSGRWVHYGSWPHPENAHPDCSRPDSDVGSPAPSTFAEPEAATRDDVARLAAELMDVNRQSALMGEMVEVLEPLASCESFRTSCAEVEAAGGCEKGYRCNGCKARAILDKIKETK